MYMYICICKCIYVYIYIYIYAFWDLPKRKQTPCCRYPSIVQIMAFPEASTDSFELLDATLVTEEKAAAAREESERLRIQEAEARLDGGAAQ